MNGTTIKISSKTLEDLKKLKIHPNQSYDEVIIKLIERGIDKKKSRG